MNDDASDGHALSVSRWRRSVSVDALVCLISIADAMIDGYPKEGGSRSTNARHFVGINPATPGTEDATLGSNT